MRCKSTLQATPLVFSFNALASNLPTNISATNNANIGKYTRAHGRKLIKLQVLKFN